MRGLLIVAVLALAGCATSGGNVGDGSDARAVDVRSYQCSTSDPARCECERAAIASGAGAAEARAACAS